MVSTDHDVAGPKPGDLDFGTVDRATGDHTGSGDRDEWSAPGAGKLANTRSTGDKPNSWDNIARHRYNRDDTE